MSYNVVIAADFGAGNTGLTVHGKLFGTNGAQVGSTITSGFVEAVAGLYVYVLSAPDSQEGVFVAYDSSNATLRRVAVIAPRETENADVKSSTLATVATIMAEIVTGSKTVEDVLRNLWSVNVGDSEADDADNPTSIEYQDADGSVDVTHTLTDTTRTVA